MSSLTKTLRAIFLLSLTAPAGFCQTISGTVKDSQGAAIAAASVTLVARDNTWSAAVTSDSTGRYRFERVAGGDYLLEAGAPGFARSGARELSLRKDVPANVDFELRVAGVQTELVVTASATAQTTDEIGKAVSVVEAQSIDLRDESAITDALRYVPGLRVTQLGGPGAFVSIKTRGLRNQDTAVLIDGFRMRDAAATQGDASGITEDLMVTDLDRIEVLRGAGSSIYGTDATGGVVNLITTQGGDRTRGSVLAEGGSLSMFRGRAEIAGGLASRRLQYSAGIGHFDVLSGVGGDLPARTSSAQGRLDYTLSPTTQLFARIFAADSFSKLSSSPGTAVTAPPAGIVDAAPPGTPGATFVPDTDDPDFLRAQRIFSGAVRLSSHPSDSLGLSASYQGLTTRRRFDDGPAGAGYQPSGSTHSYYDGDIHTATGRVDWRVGRHQLIDAGYEFEDERYGNHSILPNPADNSAADVVERSHAVFAQDQLHFLGDRLQIAGSYRAQFFTLQQPLLTPVASAPYAGLTFSAPPAAQTGDGSAAWFVRRTGTKFRAHVGKGYRAPSLYERFGTYYSSFGYSAYGDPRLRPDRSISADGGIDQSLANGRARLSATYFYTRLQEVITFDSSGLIQPATDPYGRYGGYRNTNGGLARGVELSASVTPIRGWSVLGAYTFTNARERAPLADGALQSYAIPSHQVSLLVTGRVTSRLTAIFNFLATSNYLAPLFDNVNFVSRSYRFPGPRNGELGASYRVPLSESRALRFFGKGSNVFNQTYYESGYRTPGVTGTGGMQFEF